MNISEKLDLLMTLAGISNSALGRALSYDPSYISRVRSGKRGLPRRQPFLEPASAFLARAIQTPIQEKGAAGLLALDGPWPKDPEQGAACLLAWLQAAPEDINEPIRQFFQTIAAPRSSERLIPPADPLPPISDPAFFYGNPGKREAVARFLTDLCTEEPGGSLFLVSDEAMDWLYEDPIFGQQWAALLTRFLSQGGRITMIHTIDRDLGEMLEALQRWIPLYLTGGIFSYYCPRVRDGVCRRSLFVAPGRAALTSSSIETGTEGMLNLYTRDPRAVEAYEKEFANYLALCRPLMEIYTGDRKDQFIRRMTDTVRRPGPLFFAGPVPLPLSDDRSAAAQPLYRALTARLKAGEPVTELLRLPVPGAVLDGTVALPLSDMLDQPGSVCTSGFFLTHVSEALNRMERDPQYAAVLTDRLPASVGLLARNREEVLVFPAEPPSTVFVLTEPRMASALWDYLDRAAGPADRAAARRKLKNWLDRLDRLMKQESD